MGKYYLHNGINLLAVGDCPDGMEKMQAGLDEIVGYGDPPESLFFPSPPPPSYKELRSEKYPNLAEVGDILSKVYSSDPEMQEAGRRQAAAYSARCMEVKASFPKE